jgi:UDP-sugar transporter A1/2/3
MALPLKWIALAILVIQNSSLVLVMRYSKTIASNNYITSTAVVTAEVFKLIASLILYYLERRTYTPSITAFANDVIQNSFDAQSKWKEMTVPAILYFIQNNLQYIAVGNLDAATFQVTYQMKILTTALFSVLMLNKALSGQKWLSLLLLTFGIGIVQVSNHNRSSGASSNTVGLTAVFIACILSGLAGVWFEKVLKGSKSSLYIRNVQLCIFSIIPGLIFGVFLNDGRRVLKQGFFGGYDFWTWATISNQAVGGLIVAMVVKYADNILKGFATSISIVISCIASVFIFDFQITSSFLVGACLVLIGMFNYLIR